MKGSWADALVGRIRKLKDDKPDVLVGDVDVLPIEDDSVRRVVRVAGDDSTADGLAAIEDHDAALEIGDDHQVSASGDVEDLLEPTELRDDVRRLRRRCVGEPDTVRASEVENAPLSGAGRRRDEFRGVPEASRRGGI